MSFQTSHFALTCSCFVSGEGKLVLEALRYAASLRDPVGFVGVPTAIPPGEIPTGVGEVYAWRMFQNVVSILQKFGALEDTNATDLGQMVGSLSADNELWLAMVLQVSITTILIPTSSVK